MLQKKPIRKPNLERGCESCIFKDSDFSIDTVNPNIVRCYCKARHFNVDAEMMSKDCDFWKLSPSYEKPQKDNNRYGL